VLLENRHGRAVEKLPVAGLRRAQGRFGRLALADVGVPANQALDLTGRIDDRPTASQYPFITAIAAEHAVLRAIELAFSPQVRMQLSDDPRAVFRMDSFLPG